jgi:subtilisin
MFEEEFFESKSILDYQRVLQRLKEVDEELYQFVIQRMPRQRWQSMMQDMRVHRPDLYTKLLKFLVAVKKGRETVNLSPEVTVKDGLRELAQELAATYKCDEGFAEEPNLTRTVTVYLKLPEKIVGLPKDLMKMSHNLAKDHGGRRKWTFGFDNRMFVTDLEDAAIEELRKSPLVERVEVEPMAHILSNEIPAYNPSGVNTDWGVTRINPQYAWGQGNYGKSMSGRRIKVCVIDTGIKSSHEVFWKDGVCVFKGGYNFVGGNPNPEDDHDHGTYCCSIVAAQHNAIVGSYRGVAPDIDLYACKVMDSKGWGSMANVAAGIDWARANGMDIISMSLGGSSGTTSLQQACDSAWYAGLLVVAAAGNSGPGENTVNYPGKYASVMAVAAMDFYEGIADFSSRGPETEVSAPGRYIAGAWAGFTYDNYVVVGSGNRYMCASGTSAACPHVAAGAALLKAWYPSMTNTEMRQWIREHCRDL